MPASETTRHGKRALRWAERVLWIALLLWIGGRLAPQISAWSGLGKPLGPAPPLALETRDGTHIGERELRDRVVVVNFWATWCLPCRVEMPTLQALHERHADDGLVVLGLATDGENVQAVNAFLEELDITFPIAAASSELRAGYGGVDRLPTTILIDRRGTIRHRVEGLFAPPALEGAVRRLLDEG